MKFAVDYSNSSKKVDMFNPSSTRTLSFNGVYVCPERLKKGNSKLVNILIFDLPAIKSCLNCKDCAKRCYAKKAEVQYKDTKIFRGTNFELALTDRDKLFSLICKQLDKTKVTTVRIHSSGDFFEQDYITLWHWIVRSFPKINFYAYTKVDEILDFSVIEQNKNFNLIRSFIGDNLNFGSIDYCNALNREFGTFICPATASKNSDVKCGKQCTYCVTEKNVCFVEH